jgi:hypothetical protein
MKKLLLILALLLGSTAYAAPVTPADLQQMKSDVSTLKLSSYGRVSRVAGYNVTNTATAINFDTEALDNKNAYSGGTLTIPISGVYNFNASATVISNTWAASNALTLRITKNGVEQANSTEQIHTTGYFGITTSIHDKIRCNAGDTIQITIQGNSPNTMLGSGFFPDSFDWDLIGQ